MESLSYDNTDLNARQGPTSSIQQTEEQKI